MISIIIPVYNQADKITKTLDSLKVQSLSDFEVIIVNDGSKDNLETVLENYFVSADFKNSCLILHQENKGAPAARNAGFKKSKGEYLLFCDADATLEPQALEIMKKTLDDNKVASYAYSSFYWGNKLFQLVDFDAQKLRREPYIHTMALIRRSDFPVNGFDESIKKFQDWDLWLTMLAEGHQGVFINQILFRVSPGGTISSWLPSFAYSLFPFLPAVKKYNTAKAVIIAKHHLYE